jgi:hypothetical protein
MGWLARLLGHGEWPFVSLVIRYVVNQLVGLKTHEKDDWGFVD